MTRETLKNYVGEYLMEFGRLGISVEEGSGQPMAQAEGQPEMPIFPGERDKFFWASLNAELLFVRNEQGEIDSVKLIQDGQEYLGQPVR